MINRHNLVWSWQSGLRYALVLLTGVQLLARELPSGASVRHGEVTLNIQGTTMTLDQRSAQAIVNWESFDIGHGYVVDVHQPSASASMLARVTGTAPSEILGRLTANGGFFLVNPNGILFGSGAVVDVNRLLATTRMLTDEDFLAGRLWLSGASAASVENHGVIQGESVALVAQEVIHDGLIQSAKSALVGAGQEVVLQNFDNGARLAIDFSGLGAEATRVENQGALESPGGQVVLTAGGGAGQVWASAGMVTAQSAEFSGRNSALSQLGAVHAEEVIIDPTANLVIGNSSAETAGLGYELTAADVGAEELELGVSESQPEFTEGVGYGFHDADGNGWTYMRREANTLGGTLDSYSYLDPVLTYYDSNYLNEQLSQQGVTLHYTRRGTTDGGIAIADQVRLGGSHPLRLEAEADLTVGSGVVSENASALSLQSVRDVVIGDLTTAGEMVVTAGSQLVSGRLTATEVDLSAIEQVVLSDGVTALAGDLRLAGDTIKLGGDLAAAGRIELASKQVVSVADQHFTAGDGVVVAGEWEADRHSLSVLSTAGEVRLLGEIHDASVVTAESGGGLEVSGIQSFGDIKLDSRETLAVLGAIVGQGVRLESATGDVQVNGDLSSMSGAIEATAAKELSVTGKVSASLASFAAGGDLQVTGAPGSAVDELSVVSDGAGAQVAVNWSDELAELNVATTGDGSEAVVAVGNVAGGCLSATGSGSSLELVGSAVNLDLVTTQAGAILLEGTTSLAVGSVQSERSGDVSLESGSDLLIYDRLGAADDLSVSAGGRIVLAGQEHLSSGGKMELSATDFGGGHAPLKVSAGGRLYVSAPSGTPSLPIFVRVEGTSRDGAIRTRGREVPGLVIYNGRVWLGRREQMSKVDRAESSFFSRVCQMLRREY